MQWPQLVSHLVRGEDLSYEQARGAMDAIMSGEVSPVRMAAFLVALHSKGETVQELQGLADVMVERADGHRLLLAPTPQVADFVTATYRFDEVRIAPVTADLTAGALTVTTPSLTLTAHLGRRRPLGWALRLVPASVASHPAFCALSDPIARVVMPGVRTRGTAGQGRREFYGATDVRDVVGIGARWEGQDLGALAPVDPPTRFGFSSTPRRPALTRVVTTIRGAAGGAGLPS